MVVSRKNVCNSFVEIQKWCWWKLKIQSHTFICELVEIGKDCFIGHGVVFINDKFSGGLCNIQKWKEAGIMYL